ncbi:12789_t:CDS:2, partial [Gigaspora margarita]
VFGIASDENDIFYTSCKRIALIFEPIKRVITLLESRMASLADCFLGIMQLAAAFKRIPSSNNFCSLAIVAFNRQGLQKGKFRDICELAVNYYKDLHHSEKECRELVDQLIKYKAKVTPWDLEFSYNLTPYIWWGVVEDEYTHLQELAKTMFAIVSWLESMAQIYSFYVLNVKKELNFCDNNSVDMELRNSVFNKMIFAEIDCPDLNKNEEEDKVEVVNFTANEIAIVFQDWVDISDMIFGLSNNQEENILVEEEVNMDFESRFLVQDILSDSDLGE